MSNNISKPQLSPSGPNEGLGGSLDGSKDAELFSNFTGSIYSEEGLSKFTSKTTTRGMVSYGGIEYVFVYGQDVSNVYKSQNIIPFDCSSVAQLVGCLKKYFQPYQDMYPGLWDYDWADLKNNIEGSIYLSQMILKWGRLLGIWYMGYIKKGESKLSHPGETFAVWLPFTLNGYPVRLRSVGLRQRVSFDTPTLRGEDEDRACPVVLFQP